METVCHKSPVNNAITFLSAAFSLSADCLITCTFHVMSVSSADSAWTRLPPAGSMWCHAGLAPLACERLQRRPLWRCGAVTIAGGRAGRIGICCAMFHWARGALRASRCLFSCMLRSRHFRTGSPVGNGRLIGPCPIHPRRRLRCLSGER